MPDLRRVMSAFATGVTVLTVGGDNPNGMTANAFCSVSLEPPLALCCVGRTARLHKAVSAEGHFAVSVLCADQEATARHFADRARPHGWEQFAPVAWIPGPRTGAPLITGALAWLECEVTEEIVAGDHTVFVGRVLEAASGEEGSALLFHGGAFHGLPGAAPAVSDGRVRTA
ncbi:flavin reductase family protein [Nocardiopsis metallicus]|uniref:Flavin reductase (DIM6/NTAB) family NADH-FMN oxidoreductase RutF n=1 Tax=Nocardiopsis metallicus TaxID=179819 RepID=A0A840WGV4_9ACTN|nr:flavin reductase family protein [Nocardiopsis metallicus]MBB5490947.1 flavin reductase (DIM6/NTAB) family NADH-FMN oxidoreductase RutF [Nocardiopsis metallicus]